MESRNKSDDRRGVQTLLVRGVGRLSFLFIIYRTKMSNKKKMKKKGTIFVEIDEFIKSRKQRTQSSSSHQSR